MKLVVIIGAGAVGKMTVGQELMKITDLRLFHGHMIVEPVLEVFGKWNSSAVHRARQAIFEEFAISDNYGMIFTLVMSFGNQSSWDYMAEIAETFEKEGGEVYYVEIVSDAETRLARNATQNRLAHKASKRDLEASNAREHQFNAEHRMVSNDGEMSGFKHYMKIDNTNLAADVVAQMIKERWGL